jgi:glycosyltransferase involved in cell wall biosynthesis
MKKPVILFNVGIHKDIFQNEIDAMVVEKNDINKYINAVNKLENDIELRENIAEAAYIRLEEIHKEETIYNKIIEIYTS